MECLSKCWLCSLSQHGPQLHRLPQYRFRLPGAGQCSNLRRSRPARPSWRPARVEKFSSQVRCCCSTSSTAGATMADRCCTHTTPSGRSLQTASCMHRVATIIVFGWCCRQEALHRFSEGWHCKRPAPGQGSHASPQAPQQPRSRAESCWKAALVAVASPSEPMQWTHLQAQSCLGGAVASCPGDSSCGSGHDAALVCPRHGQQDGVAGSPPLGLTGVHLRAGGVVHLQAG